MTDPEILARLMDQVEAEGKRRAAEAELLGPLVLVLDALGHEHSFHIVVPGVHPSDAIKVLLYASQARLVAVCMEAWEVEREPTDDERARLEAGRGIRPLGGRVRDQPDRHDILMVLGEIRGEPQVQRSWRLDGTPGLDRRFTFRPRPDWVPQPSRFHPLFVPYAEIRALVRATAELAALRDRVSHARN